MLKKRGVYDFDVRGKRGRERMFPLAIRRRRNDDFGEMIRPEDFLKAEEREEAENQDSGNTTRDSQGDNLGKKRKWEDFGGSNKAHMGPGKRPQFDRQLSTEDSGGVASQVGQGGDELDDLEDEEETVLGPSKLIVSKETVNVNLRIALVDFSGLHDKRSLNMLIPLIQPRKLILVGGSRDETSALAADCKKTLSAQLGATEEKNTIDVFTPEVGASVDASVDTNAWVVKLADPLVSRLKWQMVRGLGVVTVTGLLVNGHPTGRGDGAGAPDEDGASKRLKTGASSTEVVALDKPADAPSEASGMPTLDVLPINLASAVRSVAQPLHVGDLRLADLRRAMQSSGHTAEFRGEGILLVDGTVVVRKTATGRIELESAGLPMMNGGGFTAPRGGGTFYEVKRKIYEGLAVVAGA